MTVEGGDFKAYAGGAPGSGSWPTGKQTERGLKVHLHCEGRMEDDGRKTSEQ